MSRQLKTTIKQKKLLANLGKSRTVEEAMLKAGYAPSTAKQQTTILETQSWQALVEKYLPDEKLLAKHDEALEAVKQDQYSGEISPDHAIRLRATELGYKLKRKLGADTQVNIQNNGDMNMGLLVEGYKDAEA